ncbi:MAG: M16 family metallopeptidase [Alphaproteobacteria bacterium]
MSIDLTKLRNGLTVVTDTMDSVETVSVGIWVGVGTRNERADVNGIAHLLEHMAFKGTRRRTARAIAEEIEAVGGYINAYTGREQTVYYAKMLADDLPLAVDILGDILANSTIEDGELERERSVVIQEIGQARDTPDDLVFDHFQTAAYPAQAMGRPVLGSAAVVGRLGRGEILEYMRGQYVGTRMVLAAAGRVHHETLVELGERAFGGFARDGTLLAEPARYEGGELREARDLEQVHVVLGFRGVPLEDPDFFTLTVMSTLYGGGMSSRLFQEVRERRGLAYSIYSFAACYRDSGIFGVYAGTGEKEAGELLPIVGDQLADLSVSVGEDELRRARAQLKASVLMGFESTSTRAERLGHNLLTFGRVIPVDEVVQRIEAVDAAAVNRVVRRLLESRPTLAAIGPTGGLASFESLERRFAGSSGA